MRNTAVQNQLPVFCAVEAMIQEGGIATTAINYYELGKQTAAQAVRVLEGESASEIPVEFQENMDVVVNNTFAQESASLFLRKLLISSHSLLKNNKAADGTWMLFAAFLTKERLKHMFSAWFRTIQGAVTLGILWALWCSAYI